MSIIQFDAIHKAYEEGKPVISGLSLTVEEGEFVTLLGPSGCGKTTLLKMVNKLIEPDAGTISVMNKPISQWNTIELRRSIGYVIQQIGLFPHMTIGDNINYVQSIKGKGSYEQRRVQELLNIVGLPIDFEKKYPRELSGGQKQRVGVARALMPDPDIILMDEPFGAVDEIARSLLQEEIIDIQRELNKTILFVTHDIEEALKLGSKVVLMNNGNIEQSGSSNDLVYHPSNQFVSTFFGSKGFKASLDKEVIKSLYDDVLRNKITMDEVYRRLSNVD